MAWEDEVAKVFSLADADIYAIIEEQIKIAHDEGYFDGCRDTEKEFNNGRK